MRELKFRAWDKIDNKMYLIPEIDFALKEIVVWKYKDEYEKRKFFDIVLMQFTGLKDKNGKEIYGGDIVAVPYVNPIGKLCRDTINRKSRVVFKNGCFYEAINDKEGKLPLSNWQERGETEYISNYGEYTKLLDKTVLEVIGNIWENSELLK